MEVFNITNTPSFDTPTNNFTGSDFNNPPGITPLVPGADQGAFSSQGVGASPTPSAAPGRLQFYGIFSF